MPSTLGGAVHRRAAGGVEIGRAWDAGRARLSQEDNADAPARRASGTSTWRPGATRGGAMGQPEPPEEPAWPSWPAWQQRLTPPPRLLHRAHDGAPCSKQSAPCVPPPAPRRNAAGRCPRGLPGIRKQGKPPLGGAGEIIHEKAGTVLWPHARWRPQAPGPRDAAVHRQAHQLQHEVVARREVRASRKPRAHTAPEGEQRSAAPQWGPTQQCARR